MQKQELPVLAKLMLAENYLSEFYKEIAMETEENGKCKVLEELENHLKVVKEKTEITNGDDEEKNDDEGITSKTQKSKMSEKCIEWSKKPEICNWVKAEPYVGDIDLRPYYFASKEKEDYFFKQVKSEKLRFIIDGLMGPSMYIAGMKDQIGDLTVEESKFVFDTLSQKILGQGNISKKPNGIEGIIELVKVHKELQNNLIGLIRSFKMDEVGAWICIGWDKCIVDQKPKEELSNYYNLLSESGNKFVKAALKTMKV